MARVVYAPLAALLLLGCAGRDPAPVASVQPQDMYADCTMIRAEIEANNAKAKELSDEQGWKVAQNVATGVVGIVIWPVWFGMDWKGAAAKDAAALQARQQYLTTLAEQRCAPGYRPPPPPGSGPYVPQAYSPAIGWVLTRELYTNSKIEDCVMSGRTNCVTIDTNTSTY